jgi:hypothetical protein
MNAVQVAHIKTYVATRKLCYDDLVFETEREQCRQELAKKNGNGAEPERKICWCAEGIINGKRIAVHRPSDCEYVAQRSALVFAAARIATVRVGDPKGVSAVGYAWTKEFIRAMDRLSAPLLRSHASQSGNGAGEQKPD